LHRLAVQVVIELSGRLVVSLFSREPSERLTSPAGLVRGALEDERVATGLPTTRLVASGLVRVAALLATGVDDVSALWSGRLCHPSLWISRS